MRRYPSGGSARPEGPKATCRRVRPARHRVTILVVHPSDEPPPGPGTAVLVVTMPAGVRPPTDTPEEMIAWLYRHGAPRTGEALRRLERQGWTIEPPEPAADAQAELWARREFAGVEQARAAALPFRDRIAEALRWAPAGRPGDATSVPLDASECHRRR